jgi:hypothetical protein
VSKVERGVGVRGQNKEAKWKKILSSYFKTVSWRPGSGRL